MAIERIVKITVDAKQAEKSIKELKSELGTVDNMDFSINVDLDTSGVEAGVSEIQASLDELQDVDINASLDATTESMESLSISTESFSESLGKASEVQNTFSEGSTVNTLANIAQLEATANLSSGISALNTNKVKSIKTLDREVKAQEKYVKQIEDIIKAKERELKELRAEAGGYVNVANEIAAYSRKLAEEKVKLTSLTKERDKATAALKKEETAKKKASTSTNKLTSSIKEGVESVQRHTDGMTSQIPVVGNLASQFGVLGIAIAGISKVLYDVVSGSVEGDRAMKRFFDNIAANYDLMIGSIQKSSKTEWFLNFLSVLPGGAVVAPIKYAASDEAKYTEEQKKAAEDLVDMKEKQRIDEADHIKNIGDLELAIAEDRRIAEDEVGHTTLENYKAALKLQDDSKKLSDERLEVEKEKLAIMEKAAELSETTDSQRAAIESQRNLVKQAEAAGATMARTADRTIKRVIDSMVTGSKKVNKAGKPTEEDLGVVGLWRDLHVSQLEELQLFEDKKFEVEEASAKRTADMLEANRELRLAQEQAMRDHQIEMLYQYTDAMLGVSDILAVFAEDSKELKAASIIADSVAGIASIVVNTMAANAAVTAKYALLPGGAALAAAEITMNKINMGIGIAANVAATGKALSALGKGSAPSVSVPGGGAPPVYNIIEENQYNPISEQLGTIADNTSSKRPVKAYVVSKEINTQAELDRAIENSSSI